MDHNNDAYGVMQQPYITNCTLIEPNQTREPRDRLSALPSYLDFKNL